MPGPNPSTHWVPVHHKFIVNDCSFDNLFPIYDVLPLNVPDGSYWPIKNSRLKLFGSKLDEPWTQKLLLAVVGANVVGRNVGGGGNTFAGVVGDSVHVDVQSSGAPWYKWAIQFLSVIDNGDTGSRLISHVFGSIAVIVGWPLAENAPIK